MATRLRTIVYISSRVIPEKLLQLAYDHNFAIRNLKHYEGEVEPGYHYVGGQIPQPYIKAGVETSPLQKDILESMSIKTDSGENGDNPNPQGSEINSGGAQAENGGVNGGTGDDNSSDGSDSKPNGGNDVINGDNSPAEEVEKNDGEEGGESTPVTPSTTRRKKAKK